MKTLLSNFFLFLVLALISIETFGANYHFSQENGDDSRSFTQAQNPNTPWKSIQKLNEVFPSFQAGDRIMFKRGEVYLGSIIIKKSGNLGNPITIGSYGSGEPPVITGLVEIKDWISKGSGIYEATHPQFKTRPLNILVLNGENRAMGRFPNSNSEEKGFLNVDSHNGNQSVTDHSLSSEPNWNGGEIVIRKLHWILDRHQITSHSGGTINYDYISESPYSPKKDFGFFIQNHLGTLDQKGEWFYDSQNKKINVFFGSENPSQNRIEAGTVDYLLTQSGKISHIKIENLHFKGANKNAIDLKGGNDITISNCTIDFSGENGIRAEGIEKLSVLDSEILNSNNSGIELKSSNNASIKNNLIKNIQLIPGMGKSGDGNGFGIFSPNDNNLIENNQIINSGYVGIRFGGNNSIVKNNFINHFNLTKNDGGGIYVYTGKSNTHYSNRKVIGNIVLNGHGVREGTDLRSPLAKPQSEGIYLDDNTTGVEVAHNTVANISSKGIYLHNARENNIHHNVVYNSHYQLFFKNDELGADIRNNTVVNNLFFSKSPEQNNVNLLTIKNDLDQMAIFDHNTYASPMMDNFRIINRYNIGSTGEVNRVFDLMGWQKKYGMDKNSRLHPVNLPSYEIKSIIGENKFFNEQFEAHAKHMSTKYGKGYWTKNSKLDGGALSVTGTGDIETVTNIGKVEKNKKYIVKFSGIGNQDMTGKVFFRQQNAPWSPVSAVQTVEFNAKRGEYEILLIPVNNSDDTALQFIFGNLSTGEIQIDNLSVYEADLRLTDPDDAILFAYNEGRSEISIALPGEYVDMNNKTHTGSIKLAPYSSIILIKTSDYSSEIPVKKENILPLVNLESPLKDTVILAGETIKISGTAMDFDGEVKQVNIFANDSLISSLINSPYDYEWVPAKVGNYAIIMQAIDNENAITESSTINFKVKENYEHELKADENVASDSGLAIIQNVALPPSSAASVLRLKTGHTQDVDFQGYPYLSDLKYSSYFGQSYTYSNPKASADALFQSERNAEVLQYAIPLPNGTYTVKTYHNELYFGHAGLPAKAGRRVFDISLENNLVKENFDLYVENQNRPTVLTFETIHVIDGILNINMVASRNRASVSAISIIQEEKYENEVKETDHTFFLNIGGKSDELFEGVNFITESNTDGYYNKASFRFENRNATNEKLFQTERNGETLQYSIPVPNGTYTLYTFHHEMWFGYSGPTAKAGSRVFDIYLEKSPVKTDFDIFVESNNRPTMLTFENVEVSDGVLNLDLKSSQNRASISGLAIIGSGAKNSVNGANLRGYREMYKRGYREMDIQFEESQGIFTEDFKLYPNPARYKALIETDREIGSGKVLVHDMGGQLITYFDLDYIRTSPNKFSLPLDNISQGVYLVSVSDNKRILKRQRLVVNP